MTQEELLTAIFIAQIESFVWGGMLGAIVSDVFRAGVNTLVRGFRAWRQHRDLLEAIERDKARIKKEAAQ
tara:strand:+ start:496 stop:705 length:210 start_codon:yes stop_codon:yes gene_type:complete